MQSMAGLFRPNVAGIVIDGEDRLLICERQDHPESWQFPQGGVDKGETLEEALVREMDEELGLEPGQFDVIKQRGGYRYQFPEGQRRFRRYVGQEQTYFLCRLLVPDTCFQLDKHKPEFVRWRWIRPEEFDLRWLPAFKRHVYRAVLRDFFGVELAEV
jgi:putative (di)nucleoside polyphosphate hydrolase